MPLPKKKKTGNIYRVHVIDYWRMTVNTTVLAADAAAVIMDVPSLPFNAAIDVAPAAIDVM